MLAEIRVAPGTRCQSYCCSSTPFRSIESVSLRCLQQAASYLQISSLRRAVAEVIHLQIARNTANEMRNPAMEPADISFSDVADLYLAELRKGHPLSLDTLAKTFPHLADDIKENLPALGLLEQAMGTTTFSSNALPAEELGGCRLIRELGRGAVGVVYEAHQQELGRRVAIKVIPVQENAAGASIQRFELERMALGRLEHPHIVPVYSYGVNDQHAYLIMKLIDGHSLYDLQNQQGNFRMQFHIAELKSNWDQLAQFGADVASGLHHAHLQGLVHRDIKPGNLLLDESGKVWISDFGLAKILDYARSLSRTGDAIGTPRYMAPEQLRGVCDARSDVYSLGVTMYELASGERAWNDKSNIDLLTERNSLALTPLEEMQPNIPSDLAKIIMKACELSPSDRYQTAQELEFVLNRFLARHYPGDRRKRKREPNEVFRQKSRQRMLIASLAVLCTSLTLGVVSVWQGDGNVVQSSSIPQLVAQASPTDSAASLIDRLADRNQDDMVKIVSDFVHESLDETSNELQFSEPAKEEIRKQVNTITKQIKTTGLTEESLAQFLEGYRRTSLPIATKVMRLTLVVQKSGLTPQERLGAITMLRGLATATLNGHIDENQVDSLVDELTGGKVSSSADVAAMYVHDQRLRAWLAALSQRLANLPPTAFTLGSSVQKELQPVFDQAFKSNGNTQELRQMPTSRGQEL